MNKNKKARRTVTLNVSPAMLDAIAPPSGIRFLKYTGKDTKQYLNNK
jgi:hypothetical protein